MNIVIVECVCHDGSAVHEEASAYIPNTEPLYVCPEDVSLGDIDCSARSTRSIELVTVPCRLLYLRDGVQGLTCKSYRQGQPILL